MNAPAPHVAPWWLAALYLTVAVFALAAAAAAWVAQSGRRTVLARLAQRRAASALLVLGADDLGDAEVGAARAPAAAFLARVVPPGMRSRETLDRL
ncbi:MAG TPA: hypothetical protein VGD56_22795, partial [Gemmatirosa sp.]